MLKLTVNGREVEVVPGTTVLQACARVGEEIPRFCYHERLLVAGNCRRCLVEIEKSPKPVASCARPAAAGRAVHTDTPLVRKAREGVREFLLANHPLDCPICDQGGECDLQDQSRRYGSDRSRYFATKRSVEDKDLGPVVKTVRTRCIQCTRCIRFATEVAGIGDLGATGRGNQVEIGTYIGRRLTSELSGNVIDLCPVGALTAKPLSAQYRSWELESRDGVDHFDGRGSSVRWQTRAGKLRRALPRANDELNQEWATDKLRFAWDGYRHQRLSVPQLRFAEPKLRAVEPGALADHRHAGRSDGGTCRVVRGPGVDREGAAALAEWRSADTLFETRTGSGVVDYRARVRRPGRVEQADVVVLVGTNPRKEAPLLNVKLRERFLSGECKFYSYGPSADLTYPVQSRVDFANSYPKVLAGAKNPLVLVGERVADRRVPLREAGRGSLALLPRSANTRDAWRAEPRFSYPWARSVGRVDYQLLVGVSEGDRERVGVTPQECLARAKCTVVLASHGEDWRAQASAVLPILTFLEKGGTRRNRRGDLRYNPPVVAPRCPEARAVEDVRRRLPRRRTAPVTPRLLDGPAYPGAQLVRGPGSAARPLIRPARVDYHREGHVLARYSPTRAKCSAAQLEVDSNFRQ